MSLSIEIDSGKVFISLQNLQTDKGIPLHEFIDFSKPHPLERLLQIEKRSDPNDSPDDLLALQEIDRTIKDLYLVGTEAEKAATQYWLASLFLLYCDRYQLNREGFPCRRAWIQLLKLRYHSLVALQTICRKESEEKKGTAFKDEDILKQLPTALREWRTFCQDSQNHFWFPSDNELGNPEEEVWKIINGTTNAWRKPYSFFLENRQGGPRGREALRRRFIAEWLLNDRYDWWGAFCLCCHSWGFGPKVGVIGLGVLLISSILLAVVYFPLFKWFLLGLAIVALVISFGSETLVELLVPRLWAAVAVGYVPMLVTGEVWEASGKIFWTGVAVFWFISLVLSCLYLRWEIGNKLNRTPKLEIQVPICRALVLLVIGVLISLVLGLISLDLVGKPFIEIYLKGGSQLSHGQSVQGFFSPIYLKILFSFAPVALLLGVVLQIFWHERSVTAPV